MRARSALIRRAVGPALAVLLAFLTVALCLTDFLSAAETDPGCQGHSLCAPSGPSAPVVAAVARDVRHREPTSTSSIWRPIEPAPSARSQRGPTRSAPRAPPPSLA
jgi:hypothetical protein